MFPLVAHRGIEPLFSHRKCGVLPLDECAIKERCCVGGVNLSPTLAQTRRGKHVCSEGYDFPHLIYFNAFRTTFFRTPFVDAIGFEPMFVTNYTVTPQRSPYTHPFVWQVGIEPTLMTWGFNPSLNRLSYSHIFCSDEGTRTPNSHRDRVVL